MTRWAKDVSPLNVWTEYPRPQMTRQDWMNLNGLWEYAIVSREVDFVSAFDGEILVPFPLESALSGVKKPLLPQERLWYRRSFRIPEEWKEQKILLHFGAVDWETMVWVNGDYVGKHTGGYLPFYFDISENINRDEKNELVVAVWDPTDAYWQQRGKQVLEPKVIWYTAVSGIWQTVWLEPVSQTHIEGFKLTPDIDNEKLCVQVFIESRGSELALEVTAYDDGKVIAKVRGRPGELLELSIVEPKLWEPENPFLYDLQIKLLDNDRILDVVDSYFGMRKFSIAKDQNGQMRLCLNNMPLFHLGPLDQGYWPDGLYTPPTDEAMRFELKMCKELRFNMIRKHVKVEPARYYYYCDRMGLIVWQDMPNGGNTVGTMTSFLAVAVGSRRQDTRRYKRAGRDKMETRIDFERELREMVDTLYNYVCIGMWVPFNEGWGQYDAVRISQWLKEYDPTRPVDHASGWFDQGGGDFKSLHIYVKKLPRKQPRKGRGVLLSEFGGYSLTCEGHIWNPGTDYGYKKFTSEESLTAAYVELLEEQLMPWTALGLSGAVYTQTTDVEIETNGYLTYDREILKMKKDAIIPLHRKITKSI
jgi:beta-galactosidase/beta-glucuronidase